jgi:hypothetical protein
VSVRSGTAFALGGVALLTAGALGATVMFVTLSDTVPATLRAAQSDTDVPVVEREYLDERTVHLHVEVAPEAMIAAPADGRITALSCQVGDLFESGRVNARIDGRSIVNLATSVPLWRGLTVGQRGDDVAALQSELARLGFPVPTTDTLSRSAVSAVNQLLGEATTTRQIDVSRVLWLPAPTVEIARCTAPLGRYVSLDDPLASASSAPTVRIDDAPEGLVPGARAVRVDTVDIAVGDDGLISLEGASALTRTAAYRTAIADGSAEFEVSGVLLLTQPVAVSAVPPGAIFDLAKDRGCVMTDEGARAVVVVGSQLGQTFVTFEGTTPQTVRAQAGEDPPACR